MKAVSGTPGVWQIPVDWIAGFVALECLGYYLVFLGCGTWGACGGGSWPPAEWLASSG